MAIVKSLVLVPTPLEWFVRVRADRTFFLPDIPQVFDHQFFFSSRCGGADTLTCVECAQFVTSSGACLLNCKIFRKGAQADEFGRAFAAHARDTAHHIKDL
ncbi:hypothetical protein D3C80_1465450 [compost metagenome]